MTGNYGCLILLKPLAQAREASGRSGQRSSVEHLTVASASRAVKRSQLRRDFRVLSQSVDRLLGRGFIESFVGLSSLARRPIRCRDRWRGLHGIKNNTDRPL